MCKSSRRFTDSLVIGERIVPPLSIVYLVVKLRIVPPGSKESEKEKESDEKKTAALEKSDDEFLTSRQDTEDMPKGASDSGWAHAPFWPSVGILSDIRTCTEPHLYCC